MKILVACECSQTVCKAFREEGHDAYSCDIVGNYGGHPEWHIIGDCLDIIDGNVTFKTEDGISHNIEGEWDMIIAHPPCTYLSNVSTRKHTVKCTKLEEINERTLKRIEAQNFFMKISNAKCKRIAIENPVGVMSTVYRKPDQIINPYEFAESENDKENYVTKRTCLWLKGLPPLLKSNCLPKPNNAQIYGKHPNGNARCWTEMVTKNVPTTRSKTFPGIAKEFAKQWGKCKNDKRV